MSWSKIGNTGTTTPPSKNYCPCPKHADDAQSVNLREPWLIVSVVERTLPGFFPDRSVNGEQLRGSIVCRIFTNVLRSHGRSTVQVVSEMFKRTVIVLAFLNGMLSDVASVAGETYDSGRSSADSVQCQNNYDADKQSFFVNGRQRGTPNDTKMKEGYTITRGIGAHKLFNKRLKWNAARQVCMRDGGYLAIINSVAEESVLLRYMEQQNIGEAWLGIHDLYEEGDWVTLTGESLEEAGFDKWTTAFANEPDNYGGNQNCGILVKASGLDDVVCTLPYFYICEIDIV